MNAVRKLRAEHHLDPILRALAEAPLGPPDPPEIAAAIREGQELNRFAPRRTSQHRNS
ncbi:MAG: hypothetical protein IPK82_19910 [Polyangiaceae bacterium]|nr:hypothetical protein [Polyangiaceae bacterium]